MAKEIEETTDDAPEEAPRARRTTEEVEQAVLATLGRKKKRLIDIIAESGVCRSSTAKVLKVQVELGQVAHHAGGFYSLAAGVEADRDTKPAKPARRAPEPAPEAPAEDEPVVFSPEETGILAYLAKPGLLALLAKVERLG